MILDDSGSITKNGVVGEEQDLHFMRCLYVYDDYYYFKRSKMREGETYIINYFTSEFV